MSLIERYVHQVGRRLPSAQREDVKRELRSTIQDAIDDRAGEGADAEALRSATLETLCEFGRPEDLAASYVGARFLIGPDLYPAFVTTARAVLGIVLALVVVGWALGNDWTGSYGSLALGFAELVSELIDSVLGLLGLIVVIFAIVQRIGEREAEIAVEESDREPGASDEESAPWDPTTLPGLPGEDRIERGEEIAGLCFVVLALALVNFFPDRLGAFVTINGDGAWIPFFGPSLREHLPLFNLVFGGWLALSAWLLRRARWNMVLRVLDLALMLACIVLIRGVMEDPDLVRRGAEWYEERGMAGDNAQHLADTVAPIVHVVWRVALWVLLALSSWSAFTKAWRLLRTQRS